MGPRSSGCSSSRSTCARGARRRPGREAGCSPAPAGAGRDRCAASGGSRVAPRSEVRPRRAAASSLGPASAQVEVGAEDERVVRLELRRAGAPSAPPGRRRRATCSPAGPEDRDARSPPQPAAGERAPVAASATRRWSTIGSSIAVLSSIGSGGEDRVAAVAPLPGVPHRGDVAQVPARGASRARPCPRADRVRFMISRGRLAARPALGHGGVAAVGLLQQHHQRERLVARQRPPAPDHLQQPASADPHVPAQHQQGARGAATRSGARSSAIGRADVGAPAAEPGVAVGGQVIRSGRALTSTHCRIASIRASWVGRR